MSLEQLEAEILKLSQKDKERLIDWFGEHLPKLLNDDESELSDEQKSEILRRRERALAHPQLLEPWNGVDQLRERLNELRHQKTSSG